MARNNDNDMFMKLRFHSNKPAPHNAGPTPERNDGRVKKLKARIAHWEATNKSAVHEHHKPGSLKK